MDKVTLLKIWWDAEWGATEIPNFHSIYLFAQKLQTESMSTPPSWQYTVEILKQVLTCLVQVPVNTTDVDADTSAQV